jgi:nitrogen fixation protein NifU and related proteins
MSRFLYQQMIIDHSKNPCGFKELPGGCCESAHNPMCGDKINLCVTLECDRIDNIEFNASGCSISIAAASILVAVMKGVDIQTFHTIMTEYLKMLRGDAYQALPKKLEVFSGVCQYPMRVKCASFVWHAAKAAIEKAQAPLAISDNAQGYWKDLVEDQKGVGISLQFKQIGCMGWQFVPSVVSEIPTGMKVLSFNKVELYIDPSIAASIQGTEIDYISEGGMGQSKIVFSHPKAKTHCGCGESFFMEKA